MSQGTFSFGKSVVIAVAAVLLTVSQSQAAPPAGTVGGQHVGQHQHGVGFRHGRIFPGFVGYAGFYGYPYSNLDYLYAAREQQYEAALFLQAQQYRAALLQMQSAVLRSQVEQQRWQQAQQTPAESKGQAPAQWAPKPKPAGRQVVLTQEDRAVAKLKMAKVLAEDGQTADAADYFREIVQKYPGTVAAREAQQSLDKVNR